MRQKDFRGKLPKVAPEQANLQVFEHRHSVEQTNILISPSQTGAAYLMLLQSTELDVVEQNAAAADTVGSGRHIDKRRLTGAVGADDGVDPPRHEFPRDIV